MPALARKSRLLFHWRAAMASMRTLGNLDAVFTRTGTATAVDSAGTTYTARDAQPRFDWVDLDADSIRETPTLLMGAADVCYFPYLAPPRALTLYVRLILGQAIGGADATFGIVHIGNAANNAARIQIKHTLATAGIHALHSNDSADVVTTALNTAVSGDKLELLLQLAATGAIQLYQSINGAAETSTVATATNALNTAWGDTRLYLSGLGATAPGVNSFREVKVSTGARTLAQMRIGF